MKTLIIYATKNGSTREVAHLLKQELVGEVKLVDIVEEEVDDISPYDNILIGSSVYFAQIHRKMKDFIYLHRPEILNRRFGVFLMAGEQDMAAMERQLKGTIPNDIFEKAAIVSVIGSEMKLERFSWIVRFILKYMKKIKSNYRDISEEKITEFAVYFNEAVQIDSEPFLENEIEL